MPVYKIPRWLLALLVACIPALVTVFFINGALKSTPYDYIPHQENDVVGYWHYIATFGEAGFKGGYYTPDEHPAQASFVHFDTHGPGFPVLMGTLAHFTGWQPYSSILFNMGFITVALLIFMVAVRLDRVQIVATGALVFTFWPLLLFMPTGFQETLHQSAAVIVAGIFYLLMVRPGNGSLWLRLVAVVFIFVMAIVRLSWVLCFLPIFFLGTKPRSKWSILWALLGMVGLSAAVFLIVRATSAPGVNTLLDTMNAFRISVRAGIGRLVYYLYMNMQGLFSGSPITILQNIQIFALVMTAYVGLIRRRVRSSSVLNNPQRIEPLLRLWNLTSILLAGFILYLFPGYYRIFSVPLLITLLLFIALRRFRWVGFIVVSNLLFTGAFLAEYALWQPNFGYDQSVFVQTRAEVTQYVTYDANAPNAWCNTLLIDVRLYDRRVMTIPAGIGITYVLKPDQLQFPLKSRYLLFDSAADLDLYRRLQPNLNARLLQRLSIGDLYVNEDAICE
jgi:hypothetical protein